jgi:hypothetical protein
MLKKLKSHVQERDMFGYPNTLNFAKKSEFTTIPGGSLSIWLLLFMGWLGMLKTINMVTYNDDTINVNQQISDYEEIGEINMGEVSNLPFYIPEYKRRYIHLDKQKEFTDHVNATFVQRIYKDHHHHEQNVPARQCTP